VSVTSAAPRGETTASELAGERAWESSVTQLERAARVVGFDPGLTEMLSRPRRSVRDAAVCALVSRVAETHKTGGLYP
jgi:hypothetical protein